MGAVAVLIWVSNTPYLKKGTTAVRRNRGEYQRKAQHWLLLREHTESPFIPSSALDFRFPRAVRFRPLVSGDERKTTAADRAKPRNVFALRAYS
jgi:hypothetical protein